VLGNDTDADRNTLTASLVTGVSNGTLAFTSTGAFTYTPKANFNGTDSFTYQANDGTVNSVAATVTITVTPVNDAPVLVAIGNKTVPENALLTFTVSATDPDADTLTYTATGLPTGASFDPATRTFSWTPSYTQSGTYPSVTFTVTDSGTPGLTASEAITITVTNVNRAPVLAAIGNKTVLENALLSFTVSATDPDADTLTYTATGLPTGASFDPATRTFSWTPSYTQSGTYPLVTFTVTDSGTPGLTASEAITITVTNVNRAPVAANDTNSTAEDTPLTITAPGVLGNDSDVDGDPLTAVLIASPTKGTLTLNANGSFTYTPNANYNGSDSFTYKASDGTLQSAVTTVTLTVTAVNDAPVAVNDSYSTPQGTPLNVSAPGVLVNDSDVDSPTLTAVLVTGPTKGTLTLNANGSFTYTPNAGYSGGDSFTYKANDGKADSNVATVSISVVSATAATFTASGTHPVTGKPLSATVTFDIVSGRLVATITNTSPADVTDPSEVLTALFFKVKNEPVLTPYSALLANYGQTGGSKVIGGADGAGNIGGEFAYKAAIAGPLGANRGISAANYGTLFSNANLRGSNLGGTGLGNVDGINYGLTSAGDSATTALTEPVIQNSVVIQLTPSVQFNPKTDITNVSFQYGASLTDRNLPGVAQ